MAGLVQFKIEGIEGLADTLAALGNSKSIRKALTQALIEATEPAVEEAKNRLLPHSKSGRTIEKIAVLKSLSRSQKRQNRPTGLDEGAAYFGLEPGGPGLLIEFGTSPRRWKGGKSTGQMPAFPFLRPTWEHQKMQILERFSAIIWKEIEKEAKRLERKNRGRK